MQCFKRGQGRGFGLPLTCLAADEHYGSQENERATTELQWSHRLTQDHRGQSDGHQGFKGRKRCTPSMNLEMAGIPRQPDMERAPLAEVTLGPDAPPVQFDNTLADRQP